MPTGKDLEVAELISRDGARRVTGVDPARPERLHAG